MLRQEICPWSIQDPAELECIDKMKDERICGWRDKQELDHEGPCRSEEGL